MYAIGDKRGIFVRLIRSSESEKELMLINAEREEKIRQYYYWRRRRSEDSKFKQAKMSMDDFRFKNRKLFHEKEDHDERGREIKKAKITDEPINWESINNKRSQPNSNWNWDITVSLIKLK